MKTRIERGLFAAALGDARCAAVAPLIRAAAAVGRSLTHVRMAVPIVWSCCVIIPLYFAVTGVLFAATVDAQAAAPSGANEVGATPVAPAATAAPSLTATNAMNATNAVRATAATPRVPAPMVPAGACNWPLLRNLIGQLVQADGRVIDRGPPEQSTSEGQSYGLFFALVNNDRKTFDRILQWTEANLAGGDLSKRLPAWHWGIRPDGTYGVLDANAASDADLWIAYDLAEAGRLWHEPRYATVAHALFRLISDHEVFDLPDFGPMLAPGPSGFAVAADLWRVNASYVPLPLLRFAALYDRDGPWRRIAANTLKMIQATAPHGFVPDWAAYQTGKGFVVDPVKGDVGSYDAVRTYLWAGVTSSADPLAKPMLTALAGMQEVIQRGDPVPEKISTLSGVGGGNAPVGFLAALLPYLRASGNAAAFNALRGRVGELVATAPLNYYNGMLTLFGQGAIEGRYQFDARGRVQPDWSARCGAGAGR